MSKGSEQSSSAEQLVPLAWTFWHPGRRAYCWVGRDARSGSCCKADSTFAAWVEVIVKGFHFTGKSAIADGVTVELPRTEKWLVVKDETLLRIAPEKKY